MAKEFSPDGGTLMLVGGAMNLKTGEVRSDPAGERRLPWRWARSVDGRFLAKLIRDQAQDDLAVAVCDSTTNRELFRIDASEKRIQGLCFTSDSRILLASRHGETQLGMWSVPDGRPLGRWELGRKAPGFPGSVIFSPNGAIMAHAQMNGQGVGLWEIGTGDEMAFISRPGVLHVGAMSFSPDGSLLAIGYSDGRIELRRLADPYKAHTLFGHFDDVRAIAFSPDGTRLATASGDRTILVWKNPVSASTTAVVDDLNKSWEELGTSKRALSLVRRLASNPQAVRRLSAKLTTPTVPPGGLDGVIADLDHMDPARREEATRALERAGGQAEPTLQRELQRSISPEVRMRIERLLEPYRTLVRIPKGPALARHRALQVLEAAGTTEARVALEWVAAQSGSGRERDEARAALKRLGSK